MNIVLIAKKVQAYRRDLFVAAPQIKLVDGDLPNPPVADASAIDEAFELNRSRGQVCVSTRHFRRRVVVAI